MEPELTYEEWVAENLRILARLKEQGVKLPTDEEIDAELARVNAKFPLDQPLLPPEDPKT